VSAATSLISIVVLVLDLGLAAQILADRLQIPSVLFLIVAGVLVGPEGLGLVGLESFGSVEPLSAIVGLSVAIIVFEGAFHLKLEKLRQTPREALRLVTVGAGIVFVGSAVAIRLGLGVSWTSSFLIASLLIATGPTVITPILDVVPVRDRVAAPLETEGIVNDVSAAILAIALIEISRTGGSSLNVFVRSFVSRLGIGILVGVFAAAILGYLLKHVGLSPTNAIQNS
jgi:NhaP-type Na+/H+ or K+/H+ antiporter